MKKVFKNVSYPTIAILILLVFLETIFTIFFIFKSGFYGPLAKIFVEKKYEQIEESIRTVPIDKFTNKLIPGSYEVDGVIYKINSKGFRGNEFNKKNLLNCRVISFGGSITFGREVDYPSILNDLFKKNNINCESLNFGMTSQGLNYIENIFLNEALEYSPNIITIMTNRNSTMYDSYSSSSISPNIIQTKKDYFFFRLNKYLFSKSMTYRFIDLSYKKFFAVAVLDDEGDKIIPPYNTNIYNLVNYFDKKYLNQILNIINIAERNNIKVILIKEGYYLKPEIQKQIDQLSKSEIILKLKNYKYNYTKESNDLFWIYTNAVLNKNLEEIKKIYTNVNLLDPTIQFYLKNKENYFLPDGNHLNIYGHEFIANKLYRLILEEINKN